MLPYDRKRAFRKQWLYLGTFLTVIFLTVTNLEMVAEVLRSGRKLGAGWTESYILKVLTGDGIRLYFPLLCTVPYATGFVDEYKSGIYKFVLVRKERKKYIISKAITNAIAGGSILVAGTVAFILCTWIVFLDYTEFFGEIWTDVVSVFCFWSTGSRNRNVDFNAGESSIHGMACTIYE